MLELIAIVVVFPDLSLTSLRHDDRTRLTFDCAVSNRKASRHFVDLSTKTAIPISASARGHAPAFCGHHRKPGNALCLRDLAWTRLMALFRAPACDRVCA